MQLSELHRFPVQTQVLQLRSEVAALPFQNLLLKCIIEERAYNPNQPRVPAGEPDGGQWTDGGFHRLKPRYDAGRRDEEDAVQVAQNRGGFDPVVRLGRSWVGATQAQQVRLAVSQAQAIAAVGRAQRADPSWRPGPGISAATIEGEIGRNEALAREANVHLIGLGRRAPERAQSPEIFAPSGARIGARERGATDEVRTVPWGQFRELLDQVTTGAQSITTPQRYEGQWYRRFDGSVIGVRFSKQNGITIDIVASPSSPGLMRLRVHSK